MRYTPKISRKEIEENKKIFDERLSIYKKEGLDFLRSREFILNKTGITKRKVLDIGTGRGLSAICLAEAGCAVTSIDVDEEMLRIAALNIAGKGLLGKAKLYKMDAYSMDFDNESFDAVFMVEAVHHIGKIEKLLNEIDRVLAPKGKIVLSDFNKRGMSIVDKVHKSEGHEHVNLSAGTGKIRNLLRANGYKTDTYNGKCHWLMVGGKK